MPCECSVFDGMHQVLYLAFGVAVAEEALLRLAEQAELRGNVSYCDCDMARPQLLKGICQGDGASVFQEERVSGFREEDSFGLCPCTRRVGFHPHNFHEVVDC